MASAILTSRNNTPRSRSRSLSSDYLSTFTNSDNSNFNFTRFQNVTNPNPNPNSNPNSRHFFVGNTSRGVIWTPHPPPPQQQPEFISGSINSGQPRFSVSGSGYRYITFRINSYTKTGLKQLKKRLVSDLERVRILRQRVCLPVTPKLNYYNNNIKLPEAQKRGNGQKRTKLLPPVREMKKQCGRMTVTQKRKMMMKQCGTILGKLMQHKHGWVFNNPVDAAGLKLYDYHNVISNPMDLRTIKSKLERNEYGCASVFASDVRLTFRNAMVYNGNGSSVYVMAERMLLMFEELFDPLSRKGVGNGKRVRKQNNNNNNKNNRVVVEVENEVEAPPEQVVRGLDKREMTEEEKAELADGFLNLKLGTDGMNQVVDILKKGVLGLEYKGDEIDIDLGVLDNDTLWELHGFVASARKECVANLVDDYAGDEQNLVENDEYIDIGEEMQSTVFPPVVIEKDAVNVSSSESSSDSDSSSSDSGSGNSYDEEEVNSTPKVDHE